MDAWDVAGKGGGGSAVGNSRLIQHANGQRQSSRQPRSWFCTLADHLKIGHRKSVMAADVPCRASKRRKCARTAGPAPSAVHYVGYVEDDETPESIARKFEELERIEAAARPASAVLPGPAADCNNGATNGSGTGTDLAADGGLSEQQLMEVNL